jgi:hypothetical protein
LSKRNTDNLASQLVYNPMLQKMDKDTFVQLLTSDQPNIPAYFVHSVLQNKKGNTNHKSSIQSMIHLLSLDDIGSDTMVIDTRDFASSINYPLHPQAISIPHKNDGFVTLLGSLVQP